MSEKLGPYALGQVHKADCLEGLRALPEGSVQSIVTSPPYWGLRDYGQEGQWGLESTPLAYVEHMRELGRACWHALRGDGTLWLNIGDTYAGNRSYQVPDSKHKDVGNHRGMTTSRRRDDAPMPRSDMRVDGCKAKDLIGVPWRVALALQADGWYLRSDIIWHKPNPMPESVTDRPTKAHEYIFLLSKAERYHYDHEAIKEAASTAPHNSGYTSGEGYAVGPMDRGGHSQREDPDRVWAKDGRRSRRSVWTVATRPYPGAHFAVFPPDLIRPCILAGAPEGAVVCDPFSGSGTTGIVCAQTGRKFVGFDLAGGDKDLGGHTANDRAAAAAKGLPLKEYKAGQESLF